MRILLARLKEKRNATRISFGGNFDTRSSITIFFPEGVGETFCLDSLRLEIPLPSECRIHIIFCDFHANICRSSLHVARSFRQLRFGCGKLCPRPSSNLRNYQSVVREAGCCSQNLDRVLHFPGSVDHQIITFIIISQSRKQFVVDCCLKLVREVWTTSLQMARRSLAGRFSVNGKHRTLSQACLNCFFGPQSSHWHHLCSV